MTTTKNAQYQIAIVYAHAPKSNGGNYRHLVHVRVYAPKLQKTEYAKTGKGRSVKILKEWSNVDSRYNGPKSAYGQALGNAQELVELMNS